MRPDIAPGSPFPDYELPDHDNVPRKLSEIQGDDPQILTLARRHYCPKEHMQHLELAPNYPKMLKPGLIVHKIYNGYVSDPPARPSFADLWRDLREVTREIRPDWDLSTPGLREAWEPGDLAHFHGWDRRAQGVTG